VATVTTALQHLLAVATRQVQGGADVSTRAPDRAREAPFGAKNQLNVFLYQTTLDAAWRNQDPPGVIAGESGFPPLPLVLHYLVTAYGEGDDEVKAQTVLGHALATLHDHPVLGREEFAGILAGADLDEQVERIRITPQPLSVDELTKLWTAFQTNARLSASYEVSVVLVSSTRSTRTPLPVLTRGEGDAGVEAQSGILPPFPDIASVHPANGEPASVPGELLTLVGHHLAGADDVVFAHPLSGVHSQQPASVTDTEISVALPAGLPAGICTVAAGFPVPGGEKRFSNTQALAVAPAITQGVPGVVNRAPDGSATVDLRCTPDVHPEQQVLLLVGDRPVARSVQPAPPAPGPTSVVRFVVPNAPLDEFLVRLRVDGVDSRLVDRGTVPPVFDRDQRVTFQ
jgi:hypothetical protein